MTIYERSTGNTRYLIKLPGRTIETNNLEEANKAIGEAYIEKRGKDEYLIVQKYGGGELKLDNKYRGLFGRRLLEQKYPCYVMDRSIKAR